METLQALAQDAAATGSWWLYILVFLGGLAAGISPCVYPVLPLTVGYIGGAAGGRRGAAFLLSLTLVLGMALVYAVAGVAVAAAGGQFGALWGKGWVVYGIALFFMLMALFLMDVFTLPTPAFLARLQGTAGRRKGLGGAFLVGAVSGLVVGPCTGPILFVMLGTVLARLEQAEGLAFVGQALGAGLLLFLFGLGQGALILLCGTFTGLLSRLPKSGQWMVTAKKGFALLILLGASLILVYVGQATDFPSIPGLLAKLERTPDGKEASVPAASPSGPPSSASGGTPSVSPGVPGGATTEDGTAGGTTEKDAAPPSRFGGDEFLD